MSEKLTAQEEAFIGRVKRFLDEREQELSVRQTSRLQRVRREAIEKPALAPLKLSWVAGTAVLFLIVMATAFWTALPDRQNHTYPILEDLELMNSPENVELSEDLEFYDWLADSAVTG
jgi:hypothetical protein